MGWRWRSDLARTKHAGWSNQQPPPSSHSGKPLWHETTALSAPGKNSWRNTTSQNRPVHSMQIWFGRHLIFLLVDTRSSTSTTSKSLQVEMAKSIYGRDESFDWRFLWKSEKMPELLVDSPTRKQHLISGGKVVVGLPGDEKSDLMLGRRSECWGMAAPGDGKDPKVCRGGTPNCFCRQVGGGGGKTGRKLSGTRVTSVSHMSDILLW